ncbi:MAG TPA: alpha/beta fold hydrolase [Alphaproteobacteria bacterium]|nr:alpha/beta fold hydrolase [Alphaproteobacteria bacterium]HNS44507.1 alpha/beta fold hydrolase [Alphaproteobacteria bacterium]
MPPHPPADEIAAVLMGYAPVTVKTEDGLTVTGFFRPPADKQKPIILFFHGNASHPAWMAPFFSGMSGQGYGIFLVEYRGYNNNEGIPTEQGLYKDAEAYLISDPLAKDHKANPLIVFGHSLGSGVAVELASRHPERFSAMVLQVPFDSIVHVVSNKYPFVPFPSLLVKDQYNSDQKIGKVTIPKLFLLAGQDTVVGHDTGKRLYDLAPGPKILVEMPDAGHNDIYAHGTAQKVFDFVEEVLVEKK